MDNNFHCSMGGSIFSASLSKPHNCLQMFILQPPLFQSRMCPPLKLFCIVLNTSYLQLAYLELRWTENVNINYVKSAHFRILGTSGHVIYLPRILKLNAVFLIAEDNLRQGLAQGCIGTSFCCLPLTKKVSTTSGLFSPLTNQAYIPPLIKASTVLNTTFK